MGPRSPLFRWDTHRCWAPSAPEPGWSREPAQPACLPHQSPVTAAQKQHRHTNKTRYPAFFSQRHRNCLVCQLHQDTVSYFDYSHGNHFRYQQDRKASLTFLVTAVNPVPSPSYGAPLQEAHTANMTELIFIHFSITLNDTHTFHLLSFARVTPLKAERNCLSLPFSY